MLNADEPLPFAALLRRHRVAAGLTQEALAERTGLGARSIQHLEGGAHLPHRETVDRLVQGLGLSGEERSHFEVVAQRLPRQRETATPPFDRLPDDRGGDRIPRHNLPAPLTSFVGREQEIGEIEQRLRSARLLTLTGTGGCGKTRLALAVAGRLVPDYPDGVWLAELAALSDPQLVPFALASAVGLQAEPGQPVDQTLRAALRARQLLLVLDNCEHLIAACADLVALLLRGCPDLRILATSREPLGVSGEVAWRVPSLAVPPRGQLSPDLKDPTALTQFAGVGLFVERAQLVAPGFTLGGPNAPAVAQICWRLDGIPLAIELAAARVKALAVEQIAARLDDRFRLLTGGSRTALRRQQTLRALVDWSHDLLSDADRVLFRRLAVFAGDWTLEAAEGICAGDGIDASEVLDLLTSLVDKSLVVAEGHALEERYHFLETIRQYAQDRLLDAGEAGRVRDRHRDWYLNLAERAEPELIGPRQVAWLDRLEVEQDNFRVALAWSLKRGEAALGLRLAGALWRLWYVRDHENEGLDWLTRVLAAAGAQDRTVARAKVLQGVFELSAFEPDSRGEKRRRAAEESLAICQEVGDRAGAVWSMNLLGRYSLSQQDDAQAESFLTQALAMARGSGARWEMGQVFEGLGIMAGDRGEYLTARMHFEQSVGHFREVADQRAIGNALALLGAVALAQEDYGMARSTWNEYRAIAHELRSHTRIGDSLLCLGVLARAEGHDNESRGYLEESLAIGRDIGVGWLAGMALASCGWLAWSEGDKGGAKARAREALTLWRESDIYGLTTSCLLLSGVLAVDAGGVRQGARLLARAEVDRVGPILNMMLLPQDRDACNQSVSAARAALGEDAFAAAYAEGQAMTLEQAITCALEEGGA